MAKQKTPKPKRPLRKLKESIWKLRSEYTRRRDSDWREQGKCVDCGTMHNWKEADAGHYISRTYDYSTPLLLDERNVNLQAKQCNMHTDGETLKRYEIALDRKYGEGTAEELRAMKYQKRHYKYSELEAYEKELKQKLAELG